MMVVYIIAVPSGIGAVDSLHEFCFKSRHINGTAWVVSRVVVEHWYERRRSNGKGDNQDILSLWFASSQFNNVGTSSKPAIA